jgi:putative transport protein
VAWFTAFLAKYPELAVYLALGIGYWVGTRKLGGMSLGGVTGSLLAGMLIGYLFEVPVSGTAKSVLFLLFLFGIGYEVGPRFVAAMKGDGWRYAVLGVVMPVVGLLVAWAVAEWLRLDPGLAAGMMSGALTESPAMGTAVEAINALPIDAAAKERYVAHVGVADGLCYVAGALAVIFTCSVWGPKLLGIDLKAEALALEKQYGIRRERSDIAPAWRPFETRAYLLAPGSRIVGLTVRDAENLVQGARLFIHRIRRGDELLDALPGTVLQAGDHLAVGGRREVLVDAVGERADEVEDRELLSIPLASHEVLVTQPAWAGRTLGALGASDDIRGVFLRKIMRNGLEIPIGTGTVIEAGDLLLLLGPEGSMTRATEALGVAIRPTEATDFVALGFAVFLGALFGAVIAIPVGSVSVVIGTSVGTLIAGIVTGHLRLRRPLFARIPDGAIRFMQSIGLAGFVAMVGIGAGPHFVAAMRESGVGIFFGGIVVTMTPLLFGLWFGHKVLKISPLLLLGAISGAQTFTAGLAALQEKSGSPVAVLGYSGSVAVAHVVLTTWGTLMVLLIAR